MNWFTPKCPIELEDKLWVEEAFQWLIDELGPEVLADSEVILPIEEYFPDPYSGTRADIRKMVDRVCVYMDVDPGLVEVKFFENDDLARVHPFAAPESTGSHALGVYHKENGKYHISLDIAQSADPQILVATIAHELGHVILLGEERLDPEYPDHEPMTDLLTVFYGLGVFTANSVFSFEQWTNTFAQGWQMNRRGYLTEELLGYSLALFAYLRNEKKPEWNKHLSTNVRSYFKASLKFLEKTGDINVTLDGPGEPPDPPSSI